MRVLVLAVMAQLLAASAAVAQTDPLQSGAAAQANLNTLTTNAPTVLPRATSEGTKGSPYADNQWRMAQLTLSNHLPLAPVPLKYDILSQRLLMHKAPPSRDSLQLDDRLVQQFVLLSPVKADGSTDQPRLFRRFSEAPNVDNRSVFVEQLHQGRYTLLKRNFRVLKKAQLQGAYSSGERFDEIVDQSEYFLSGPNTPAKPVKLTLKSMEAAAPALAKALKAAAAGHPLRTDADWQQVLEVADPTPTQAK